MFLVLDRAGLPRHFVSKDSPVSLYQGVCEDVWVHLPPARPNLWDAKLKGWGRGSSYPKSSEVKCYILVLVSIVYVSISLVHLVFPHTYIHKKKDITENTICCEPSWWLLFYTNIANCLRLYFSPCFLFKVSICSLQVFNVFCWRSPYLASGPWCSHVANWYRQGEKQTTLFNRPLKPGLFA